MPQRLVDPSEFANDITLPGNTATPAGRRQVDPSELADTPPTDTGHPWLAAGVRGLAGILGAEGGVTGAGLAGLGETAAEALEQGTLHPNVNAARVATAAGMGAIPLSSVFKAGAPLYSTLRGGAQAAVGTGLNQWAEGQPIDPGAIALSGGIGALIGGASSDALGRFLGKATPAVEEAAAPYGPFRKPPEPEVNPITGQKTFRVPPEALQKPPLPSPAPTGPQQYDYESDVSKGLGKLLKPVVAQAPADVVGLQSAIDQSTAQGAATRAANFREAVGATKAEQAADAAWMRSKAAKQSGELTPEDMADLIANRSARGNAPVGPPPTPTVSEPPMGVAPEQAANEARAEIATTGKPSTAPVPGPETTVPASLLKFFGGENPKVSAVGQAYRAAKGEAGINPLVTQQLGAALTHQAAQEGLPTVGGTNFAKFLENRISPDIEGKFAAAEKSPMTEVPATTGTGEAPGISETPTTAGGQNWIQHQNDLIDGFNAYKAALNDKGFMSPEILHQFFAPLTGAAIGAPVGAALNQDDPITGAMYGTAAGGTLGWYASGPGNMKDALDRLIQIRNAGLLMGPAQLKKHLSDLGAYGSNAFEQAMAGNHHLASNLMREAFNPENIKNYLTTFKNVLHGEVPESAQAVIGDAASAAAERIKNAGLYERAAIAPIAAAQDATFKAMLRAGMSPEEAEKVLLLGNPTTPLGQAWNNLSAVPGFGGQIVRTVRPFARIATNLAERGLERTPGIGMLMPGENKLAKQLSGLGAMGIGAGVSAYDASQEPEDQTSPMMKGLRRAAFASSALPFTIGEAIGGTDWKDVGRMFPGINLPPVQQGESWPVTLGKTYLKQILPSWVLPDTGSAR